jgi:chromatin segregation and condensation protein Rec8/ScpA/Scc1 (kleisin family)
VHAALAKKVKKPVVGAKPKPKIKRNEPVDMLRAVLERFKEYQAVVEEQATTRVNPPRAAKRKSEVAKEVPVKRTKKVEVVEKRGVKRLSEVRQEAVKRAKTEESVRVVKGASRVTVVPKYAGVPKVSKVSKK